MGKFFDSWKQYVVSSDFEGIYYKIFPKLRIGIPVVKSNIVKINLLPGEKNLVLIMGCSGVGKTTLLKKTQAFYPNYGYISYDEISRKVFFKNGLASDFKTLEEEILCFENSILEQQNQKNTVFVEGNFLDICFRTILLYSLKDTFQNIYTIFLESDLNLVLQRNQERNLKYLNRNSLSYEETLRLQEESEISNLLCSKDVNLLRLGVDATCIIPKYQEAEILIEQLN